ncbi:sigma 54-interacting transcriptional regulator [Pseudomonas syringae group genomosp. 7]|uniref:sigma 54-interacting transcriptional regulator n=1 Tax=Pseudomonas syringae group genomosp. 7 TaxID=251699 RepID=UPI000EFDF520|nr:sigma 54-interacting transcriptional regulator [Pseudomonas syringae group genomosp. 7]RMR09404.1 Sigma-54 dependent transcriptional regulator [Pseudomonas syringae pv. helianthi]
MTSSFNSLQNSQDYAQTLISHYSVLAQSADSQSLQHDFALSAVRLSNCEASQLFLFDANHKSLCLVAEVVDSVIQQGKGKAPADDYHDQPLLQFCLLQNRAVSVPEISSSPHVTSFLPAQAREWRSLLCIPLHNRGQVPVGVLVCVSSHPGELEGYTESLAALGSFVISQLSLMALSAKPAGAIHHSRRRSAQSERYGLTGRSAALGRTIHLLSKILDSTCTVLLTGETGTGKEVVSRAIHEHGPRRSNAFVVQNCAAFPEALLESELFGYCKGAFTGADRDRPGLFELAHGGTLLLDEIGDMPMLLQAKLLRVLQEGEIRPLGANKVRKVDVRIIAATHRDLPKLIAEGRFREDLYYRLAQFPIELPPLRQRVGDIEILARHFSENACQQSQRDPVQWSQTALSALSEYTFPGNVRQLKGFVERAVLLCEDGELKPEHFPIPAQSISHSAGLSLRERIEQFERGVLLECLRDSNGNRSLAARTLGVSRRTLLYRLAHLKIGATHGRPD